MSSDEYARLFFDTIKKSPGQPADDYETVLGESGIPAGYAEYVKPTADMPFNAMTQQIGSDGRIAGRIFLPTATPDDKGYYTHPFSPLKDAAAGSPHRLEWEWRDLGGPPIVTPGESGGGTQPPAQGLTKEECQAMIDEATKPLHTEIESLKTAMAQPLHAHGPVNLPIVMDSLTSLRCKGDIDVEVKPGTATAPPQTGGGGPSEAATLVLLKKLLNRPEGQK
jgi:hypothetical protein